MLIGKEKEAEAKELKSQEKKAPFCGKDDSDCKPQFSAVFTSLSLISNRLWRVCVVGWPPELPQQQKSSATTKTTTTTTAATTAKRTAIPLGSLLSRYEAFDCRAAKFACYVATATATTTTSPS